MLPLAALRRLGRGRRQLQQVLAACWAAPQQQQLLLCGGRGLASDSAAAAGALAAKEAETPLLQSIRNRIMIRGGPLSVADYMQEVLTNPSRGYYMAQDVFGRQGDFITSPEISQMFGEMLGIWCVATWASMGQPQQLRLVELGPGRGTLMADLLRGTAGFGGFAAALQVHMVEVSPFMRQQQWQALQCRSSSGGGSDGLQAHEADVTSGTCGLNGAQVTWHSSLDSVPDGPGPALFIAHEFLDALPVHQFVRDRRRGWLEVMVDTADDADDDGSSSSSAVVDGVPLVRPPPPPMQQQQQQQHQQQQEEEPQQQQQGLHLRYVLSPSPTPAAQLLVPRRLAGLPREQAEQLQALEVGARAMAVCETIARRIASSGGAALLVDYGQPGPYGSSLTAIRRHLGVHPLSMPGSADLSAWVDFGAMALAAEQAVELAAAAAAGGGDAAAGGVHAADAPAGVQVHGPVRQADLLHALGITARLEALLQLASPAQAEALVSGYKRLVDTGAGGMGGAYLALAISQPGVEAPPGFDAHAAGGA